MKAISTTPESILLFGRSKICFDDWPEGQLVNHDVLWCHNALDNHSCRRLRTHVIRSHIRPKGRIYTPRVNAGDLYSDLPGFFDQASGESVESVLHSGIHGVVLDAGMRDAADDVE